LKAGYVGKLSVCNSGELYRTRGRGFPRFMGTLTLTWGDMRELFHNAKGGGAVIPGRSPAFHGESPYVILTSSRTLFGA